jgi:hypothetical protein
MSHMSQGATVVTNFIPNAQSALESRKSILEGLFERIETALDKYFGKDEATMQNCLRGLR